MDRKEPEPKKLEIPLVPEPRPSTTLKSPSRTKSAERKFGDITLTGEPDVLQDLDDYIKDDTSKKCNHPNWCDEDGQACEIDEETGDGQCVGMENYNKSSLIKINLNGKKIFGSKKAITELKKRLNLLYPESFLDEMQKYCKKYRINFDNFKEIMSVFEHEIALKTLTLEKMYENELLNKDKPNIRKIFKELYEKWRDNAEQTLPKTDTLSLGTPEPIKSDPGTPDELPPTTPPLDIPEGTPIEENPDKRDIDVDDALTQVKRAQSAPISSLATVQKEVIKCLGLSA